MFFFNVLMVCLSIFIYKLKLMVCICFDWLLLSNFFVLWIFKLWVVSVKLVFRFLSDFIVFKCFIVFLVNDLGLFVRRYVYVWWWFWLICFCNWCSWVSFSLFVLFIIMVLVVGILILVLIMVVYIMILYFWW